MSVSLTRAEFQKRITQLTDFLLAHIHPTKLRITYKLLKYNFQSRSRLMQQITMMTGKRLVGMGVDLRRNHPSWK